MSCQKLCRWGPLVATVLLAACAGTGDASTALAPVDRGEVEVLSEEVFVRLLPSGRIDGRDVALVRAVATRLGDPSQIHIVAEGAPIPLLRDDIAALARAAGIPGGNVTFVSQDAAYVPGAGSVRLALMRYHVHPPGCESWEDIRQAYAENRPTAALGCATQRNLMLMVEDPRDLVRGRALAPGEADVPGAAVERYRTDKVKPLAGTSSQGGGTP